MTTEHNMYKISYNTEKTVATAHVNDYAVILDVGSLDILQNPPDSKMKYKKWKFDENMMLYTKTNEVPQKYLVEYLTNTSRLEMEYEFVNGNPLDCQITNIKATPRTDELNKNETRQAGGLGDTYRVLEPENYTLLEQEFPDNYEVLERYPGHYITRGMSAGQYRNPYWKIYDAEDEIEGTFYLMDVMIKEKHTFTKISAEDINNLNTLFNGDSPTWYVAHTGYVSYTPRKIGDKRGKIQMMHQIIMDHYGNGKGQDSVDHINRDKLDNRRSNLRIISQSEQNRNTGKRTRKHNARKLPDELVKYIGGEKLAKFVTYNIEKRGENKYREFFRIEKHPNQPLNDKGKPKYISSSKGMNMSIIDKYKQILEKLEELNE